MLENVHFLKNCSSYLHIFVAMPLKLTGVFIKPISLGQGDFSTLPLNSNYLSVLLEVGSQLRSRLAKYDFNQKYYEYKGLGILIKLNQNLFPALCGHISLKKKNSSNKST